MKLADQRQHIDRAIAEREFYNDSCSKAKNGGAVAHYSFDLAQQVMHPHDPMQPGPIYFMVPRRCQVFGVHAEGTSQQVNYLIDEAVTLGKGANVVVSLLHHYLETRGDASSFHLHADNCAGQNKNKTMLWYLLWRCANKLNTDILLSFMLAGHTKFAPDWCFGLFKRKFRRTRISSLVDLARCVEESSPSVNGALVVDEDNVPSYDWTSHLQTALKPLNGISKCQHFRFTSQEPGAVYIREFVNSPEHKVVLVKPRAAIPKDLPPVIKPAGLSDQRIKYLFDNIRQFCDEDVMDIVCPKPKDHTPPSSPGIEPPPKRVNTR